MQETNHFKNTNSLDEALSQLVKSIAIEEEALASLMQAEADKTLAFVGKERNLPTQPSTSEFIQFNQTVTKMLDSILMAEWMLMKKMDSVMEFQHLLHSSGSNNAFKEKDGIYGDRDSSFDSEDIHLHNELDEIDY